MVVPNYEGFVENAYHRKGIKERKKFLPKSASILLLVAIVLFSAFAVVSGGEASTPVVWHNIGQYQRNLLIYNQAISNLNGSANGDNCKKYVSKLVHKVSGGVVTLPATNANNYSWKSDPNVTQVYMAGPSSLY